jgi:hypothetical protein
MKPSDRQRGYGLFAAFKRDSTTALQYFVCVVIGLSMLLLGVEMIWLRIHRGPDPLWGVFDAVVIIVAGIFVAHAGAIFWFKRLFMSNHRGTAARHSRSNLGRKH